MIVEILLALLGLVILLLVLPFSYSLSFEKWKLEIRISLLLGLISKRKTFSLHDEEASAEGEDSEKALNELDEALDTLEERVKDREEASAERNPVEKAAPLEVGEEEKGKEVPFSGKKFSERKRFQAPEKKGALLSFPGLLCLGKWSGRAVSGKSLSFDFPWISQDPGVQRGAWAGRPHAHWCPLRYGLCLPAESGRRNPVELCG